MKVCAYCGRENEDTDEQCSGCGLDIEVKVQKATKAGFAIRIVARIIDTVFCLGMAYLAAIFAIVAANFLNHAGMISDGWQERSQQVTYGGFILCYFAFIMYHCLCEGLYGATFGKLVCGLRVVQQDGNPSNLKGTLLRSIAIPWDGFLFGVISLIFMDNSPLNQRSGDVWGKTAVLKASEVRPESKRTVGRLFAALLLGMASYAILVILAFIYQAR